MLALTPFILAKTVFKHAEPCLKRSMFSNPGNPDYGLHLQEAVLLQEMADSRSGITNGQDKLSASCQPDSKEAMVLSKDLGAHLQRLLLATDGTI